MNLDFSPAAYPDAVALVSAYSFGDSDACEALLEDATRLARIKAWNGTSARG